MIGHLLSFRDFTTSIGTSDFVSHTSSEAALHQLAASYNQRIPSLIRHLNSRIRSVAQNTTTIEIGYQYEIKASRSAYCTTWVVHTLASEVFALLSCPVPRLRTLRFRFSDACAKWFVSCKYSEGKFYLSRGIWTLLSFYV